MGCTHVKASVYGGQEDSWGSLTSSYLMGPGWNLDVQALSLWDPIRAWLLVCFTLVEKHLKIFAVFRVAGMSTLLYEGDRWILQESEAGLWWGMCPGSQASGEACVLVRSPLLPLSFSSPILNSHLLGNLVMCRPSVSSSPGRTPGIWLTIPHRLFPLFSSLFLNLNRGLAWHQRSH